MDSLTMAVPWSTWLSRINVFATELVPSLELPLKVFRTRSPLVVVVGLGVVVWWRSRRDGGEIRRCVEVTVEMPTPYTLLYVLGYLTAALLVLDVWNLASLFPFAVLGTCNLRFSRPKSTDVGCEPVIPEPSLGATSESFHTITPPNSRRSRKLFHIPDDEEINNPLARKVNRNPLLLTPPATVPRRRYLSYEPQTPPVLRTEKPSFRTRVSSTPSNGIRRTRKGSTNRRHASENCDENLVPKKEVWDTSFELLLYNLSKSRSKSSPVQPQPRFNVSSPMSPLAPSPLMNAL